MNEYLIRAVEPEIYKYRVHAFVQTGTLENDMVVSVLNPDTPVLEAGDELIGGWDQNGTPVETPNLELWKMIRPFGNAPPIDDGQVVTKGGKATSHLEYHHFAGFQQRQLGDSQAASRMAQLYPTDTEPFAIEVRHKYFSGEANPDWDGYGWRAEIIGDISQRDPGAHAIGVYHDVECTDYWYTTGAFIRQQSEWQTDIDGDPIEVWATEYNPAHQTGSGATEPQDVHHAVLHGAGQRGYTTLGADQESVRHLYWEETQGVEPGGTWQDSGVTVNSIIGGGVYGVTDSSVFVADEPLQIDGQDTTFVREHSPGIIVVDPHIATAVGHNIFWMR